MAFGKEENEAIRKIVAEEIQDILRREFADLKASIRTEPDPKTKPIKPKRIGRQAESGYERGLPGDLMGSQSSSESVSEAVIGPTQPAGGGHHGARRDRQEDYTHVLAQSLAQAQLELSQELNINLRTLKEVITHSQDIARRIEKLLGKNDGE